MQKKTCTLCNLIHSYCAIMPCINFCSKHNTAPEKHAWSMFHSGCPGLYMQAKKRKWKENVHSIRYKRINVIALIKTKPGASGTLLRHFSLTPAETLFCSVSFVLRPTWLMETKASIHMWLWYLGTLSFYQLPLQINSKALTVTNTYMCMLKLRVERFGESILPSPPISARHANPAALM